MRSFMKLRRAAKEYAARQADLTDVLAVRLLVLDTAPGKLLPQIRYWKTRRTLNATVGRPALNARMSFSAEVSGMD